MESHLTSFWNIDMNVCITNLATTANGLTGRDAGVRLSRSGPNSLKPKKSTGAVTLLLVQFKSPIILILLFAIGLSLYLHNIVDASIIFTIVLISGMLGFWQEYELPMPLPNFWPLCKLKLL